MLLTQTRSLPSKSAILDFNHILSNGFNYRRFIIWPQNKVLQIKSLQWNYETHRKYSDCGLLGSNTMWSCDWIPKVWRNLVSQHDYYPEDISFSQMLASTYNTICCNNLEDYNLNTYCHKTSSLMYVTIKVPSSLQNN